MHLSYKTTKYKSKIYKSYSLAESYREGNTVKKKVLWKIGKLTDLQAMQIKQVCEVVKNPETILTSIKDIVVQRCKAAGSLMIADALWKEWKLSRAFVHSTNSDISTSIIARILTLNRCTAPCSHYSVPDWINKTALSEILEMDLEAINDDKLYYELDKIEQNHEYLEEHLFKMTFKRNPNHYNNVNYDLSTSYFVGMKCELSDYGISKDDKNHNKQVVLGVLVNDKGYPFKWDVYPGGTPEIETLSENIDACTKRFRLKNVNIVFDRGFVSDDNLKYIEAGTLKYISALDKYQIPNIEGIDLSIFENVTDQNYKIKLQNFTYYDDNLTYMDLGQISNRRYVLGFNPVLYKVERRIRHEKMEYFKQFVQHKNEELKNAKRSRKYKTTQQSVIDELKRLKIKKYYEDPVLQELVIEIKNKKGNQRKVTTYQVEINEKKENIITTERLDGLCVFVSNHIEQSQIGFCFTAQSIIKAYREKTKIEDVFKHLKSFIKIRPFFVNTNEHVKAVYTISMLSYFINKDLAERRKLIDGIDYLNSKKLYEPFEDYYYTTIKDIKQSKIKNNFMEFSSQTAQYIKKLGLNLVKNL